MSGEGGSEGGKFGNVNFKDTQDPGKWKACE